MIALCLLIKVGSTVSAVADSRAEERRGERRSAGGGRGWGLRENVGGEEGEEQEEAEYIRLMVEVMWRVAEVRRMKMKVEMGGHRQIL